MGKGFYNFLVKKLETDSLFLIREKVKFILLKVLAINGKT
jgi:hypothetical protein